MTGKKKLIPSSINIVKDGVTLSGKDLAQSLNSYFLSVNNDLSSLDLTSLPAYLPAPQPMPVIIPEEVCTKMLKIKTSKSNGPDNIPNRVIKEFQYVASVGSGYQQQEGAKVLLTT